jgi:hypothetical protein
VAKMVAKMTKEFECKPKLVNARVPSMPTLDLEIPWGFFDGAIQGHPPRCGVGAVLFLNISHFFHIRYGYEHEYES